MVGNSDQLLCSTRGSRDGLGQLGPAEAGSFRFRQHIQKERRMVTTVVIEVTVDNATSRADVIPQLVLLDDGVTHGEIDDYKIVESQSGRH